MFNCCSQGTLLHFGPPTRHGVACAGWGRGERGPSPPFSRLPRPPPWTLRVSSPGHEDSSPWTTRPPAFRRQHPAWPRPDQAWRNALWGPGGCLVYTARPEPPATTNQADRPASVPEGSAATPTSLRARSLMKLQPPSIRGLALGSGKKRELLGWPLHPASACH